MGHTTALSGALRIATGLILLAGAVAAGYLAHSPWIIPLLAVAFTIGFAAGRWRSWKHAAFGGSLGKAIASLPFTFIVQALLVGVLYLIGQGVGAVLGDGERETLSALTNQDYKWAAVLGAFGAVSGLVIAAMESRTPDVDLSILDDPNLSADNRTVEYPVKIGEPPSLETFFDGIHYSHSETVEGGETDYSPNQSSAGGANKIAVAEAQLDRQLPEKLRAIYRVQNGGSVNSLCIPPHASKGLPSLENILTPFSGYNDLNPLERLTTVHESFLSFADPEDDYYASYFKGGVENMIVLAQWYVETLFLDYNQPGEPRVGFVDFDQDDWPEKVRWWPSFETFFSELRHYSED